MAQKPRWGELEEEANGGDYDYLLPPKQRAMERRSWPKFGDAVQEDVGAKLTMVSTEEIIFERPRAPALLKQQGAFAKGQTKTAPVEEEVPPLHGENGKIEVWRIDGEEKTELPKEDIGKFYSGDCYICLYSYHSDEKKEDHYLCCWIRKDSIQEDQKTAVQQTTSMFNSIKCHV
ncbi:unnamed protein product [Lactuca saligna]|uniref:Eukaryotic translation initiation factor 3 subunit G N-terminal domain-containing protein n=1 Tax=Lactuca saligna TaxID=75948 RepID=A0AA35ZP12_LACSI|nr:unnamed protein product [Lactuca saligna]